MAGPPITQGSMPKRSEERRRRNKTTESGESIEVDKVYAETEDLDDTSKVDAPPADENWHQVARMQYDALLRSAMRVFYEPTDWATAYLLCDQIHRHLSPQPVMGPNGVLTKMEMDDDGEEHEVPIMKVMPMAGSTMQGILKGFAMLGMMEGDRRKLRIEIERDRPPTGMKGTVPANVIDIRKNRLDQVS